MFSFNFKKVFNQKNVACKPNISSEEKSEICNPNLKNKKLCENFIQVINCTSYLTHIHLNTQLFENKFPLKMFHNSYAM